MWGALLLANIALTVTNAVFLGRQLGFSMNIRGKEILEEQAEDRKIDFERAARMLALMKNEKDLWEVKELTKGATKKIFIKTFYRQVAYYLLTEALQSPVSETYYINEFRRRISYIHGVDRANALSDEEIMKYSEPYPWGAAEELQKKRSEEESKKKNVLLPVIAGFSVAQYSNNGVMEFGYVDSNNVLYTKEQYKDLLDKWNLNQKSQETKQPALDIRGMLNSQNQQPQQNSQTANQPFYGSQVLQTNQVQQKPIIQQPVQQSVQQVQPLQQPIQQQVQPTPQPVYQQPFTGVIGGSHQMPQQPLYQQVQPLQGQQVQPNPIQQVPPVQPIPQQVMQQTVQQVAQQMDVTNKEQLDKQRAVMNQQVFNQAMTQQQAVHQQIANNDLMSIAQSMQQRGAMHHTLYKLQNILQQSGRPFTLDQTVPHESFIGLPRIEGATFSMAMTNTGYSIPVITLNDGRQFQVQSYIENLLNGFI